MGVAGVGDDVAGADAVGGHFLQDGDQGAGGVQAQEQVVMRRASSGTAGPFSSPTMVAADSSIKRRRHLAFGAGRLLLRWPQWVSGWWESVLPWLGGRHQDSMSVQSAASASGFPRSGMLASSSLSQAA